mmetsp:Transcript_116598/g.213626  ORF Transcript_116598/g.213626 Transcript_116598/m.213626 type:complete len:155 (-) Transcript_116598:272-736(-)
MTATCNALRPSVTPAVGAVGLWSARGTLLGNAACGAALAGVVPAAAAAAVMAAVAAAEAVAVAEGAALAAAALASMAAAVLATVPAGVTAAAPAIAGADVAETAADAAAAIEAACCVPVESTGEVGTASKFCLRKAATLPPANATFQRRSWPSS